MSNLFYLSEHGEMYIWSLDLTFLECFIGTNLYKILLRTKTADPLHAVVVYNIVGL